MQQKAENKPHAHPGRTGRRGRNLPAALCGFIGRLVLVLVILACLPVPLAHLCGCEMYNVISGSMEPAIPVGSAVYVKPVQPDELAPGDVIAFTSGSSVITHRVVEIDPRQGQITTKGDANALPDVSPVRYEEVIGRVERHIPALGGLLSVYAGGPGRMYLIAFAVGGALLSFAGSLLAGAGKRARGGAEAAPPAESEANDGGPLPGGGEGAGPQAHAGGRPEQSTRAAPARPSRMRKLRRAIMVLLALVLAGSLGAVWLLEGQSARQRGFYEEEARQYTAAVRAPDGPPIEVDFEALCALNSDVAGWLYCEGTVINYPVMHGATNNTYLRRDTEKKYSNAGSIFIEALNRPGFVDYNTVIYGHNMGDGSMFAPLAQWQDQAFFDEHPVMWLLTPQQNYKVLLFSAYLTDALSDTYTAFTDPCEELNDYLRMAVELSAVESGVTPDGNAHHILLSTCGTSYSDDTRRNVLHGMLLPVG